MWHSLADLFADRAERTPEATAIRFEGETLTYADLSVRANRLARFLTERNIGPDAIVPIMLDRSPAAVVAILGVLTAGGAVMPVHPDAPPARIALMLRDADPPLLITSVRDSRGLDGLAHSPDDAKAVPAVIRLDDPDIIEALERHSPARVQDGDRRGPVRAHHLALVPYSSGTTGLPKGSGNTQAGIVNCLRWLKSEIGINAGERVLHQTTLIFDVAFLEIFLALISGNTLVIAGPGDSAEAARVTRLIQDEAVTLAFFVPTMLLDFLGEESAADCTSLRNVVATGEALAGYVQARFHERVTTATLWNAYGPSETAVEVALWRCRREDGDSTPPIGRACWETDLHILNDDLTPVEPGHIGELFIAGTPVSRGYIRRPELTQERFIACPYGPPGSMMYRTGDIVRLREDGALEFHGRNDTQIKLNGVRIELSEIDAALMGLPSIARAAVVPRQMSGRTRLVAYLVAASGGHPPDTAVIRGALADRLPASMMPSSFVFVDRFPLTDSGKLAVLELPDPELLGKQDVSDPRGPQPDHREPRTDAERILTGIWCDVLGVRTIGIRENFFHLGGDSILAIRIVHRAQRAGLEVSLRSLFLAETIEALAAMATRSRSALDDNPAEPQQISVQHAPERGAGTPLTPIAPLDDEALRRLRDAYPDVEDAYPLTPTQQGMLFRGLVERGSGDYVEQVVGIVEHHDPELIERIWIETLTRHAALRTSVALDAGEPSAIVHGTIRPNVRRLDWTRLDESARVRALNALLERDRSEDFDLVHPPLWRLYLVHEGDKRVRFVWSHHHLLLDGWSLIRLINDVDRALQDVAHGRPQSPTTALPMRNYAAWLADQDHDAGLDSWTGGFADGEYETSLGLAPPDPALGRRGRGRVALRFNRTAIDRFCRDERVTVATVLRGAVALLLSRYSCSTDVVFATTVSGRAIDLPGVESVVGNLLYTMPIRVGTGGDAAVGPWLRELQRQQVESPGHVTASMRAFQRTASGSDQHGAIQVLVNFEDYHLEDRPGALSDVEIFESAPVPLVASFSGDCDTLELHLLCDRSLFSDKAMNQVARHLVSLIGDVTADSNALLGSIGPPSPEERRNIVEQFNGTAVPLPPKPIHELIKRGPGVALRSEGLSLTYDELDREVNRLANTLRGLGAGREAPVGLYMRRSPALVIAMLAVLRAGAAYVPLDPEQRPDRITTIFRDARPSIVLTDGPAQAVLAGSEDPGPLPIVLDVIAERERIAAAPTEAPHVEVELDDRAYILYTSGSTGEPKGVAQSHRTIVNMLHWLVEEYGLGSDDRWLFKTPTTFDVSVPDVFFPLAFGGVVVIAPPEAHKDPAAIAALITAERVSVVQFVPSMLEAFVEEPAAAGCTSLKYVLSAGEKLHSHTAERFFGVLPNATLCNLYGPTETFYATHFRCHAGDGGDPPIGRPIANIRAYLLDQRGEPVPPGAVGELWIGGAGVAEGYVGSADLTGERFAADPFAPDQSAGVPGPRMYRTGDRARWRPDGQLEYLGRLDDQLKINGERIEPAEIESAIRAHPAVKQVAVRADDLPNRRQRLVAYIVPTETNPDLESIAATVRRRLPRAFVPVAWMVLDALPVTPNGKLDRRALPQPARGPDYEPPHGDTEAALALLFEDVLGSRCAPGWRAGRLTDFFAVGGDSLAATRLVARLAAAGWGKHSPRLLFDHPTPAALAIALGSAEDVGEGETWVRQTIAANSVDGSVVPASAGQSALWFLQRRDPHLTAYHLPLLWRLRGDLDVDALSCALSGLVDRHPTLRTSFGVEAGQLVQKIGPTYEVVLDTETRDGRDPSEVIDQWWKQEASVPFNLRAGVLMRARLLRIASDDHLLLINHHHIASDGWSVNVLARELSLLYNAFRAGRQVALPLPAVRYVDYSQWQRQRLDGARLTTLIDYWKPQLAGLEPLDIPTDRPRGVVERHHGDSVDFTVDEDLFRTFEELCREQGATLQMGLVAVVAVLLGRYARKDDVAVAVATLGRDHPDFEDIVGFFVNTLPIRAHVHGEVSFRRLLRQTRETSLAAYQHAELPFHRMVAETTERSESVDNPLVQVIVQVDDDTARHSLDLDRVTAEALAPESLSARFELEFFFRRTADGGLSARLVYDTGLFDRARMERLRSHLTTLLRSASALPDAAIADLPILGLDELELISQWQQGPDVESADLCVHQLFSAQVAANPDAVAVVCGEREIRYSELDARANRLAHRLIGAGVGPNSIVAVSLGRSADLIVTLLAILKSGGAYFPVDPAWPSARRTSALSAIGPTRLTVTTDRHASEWEDAERLVDPSDPALSAYPSEPPDTKGHNAGQLAYVSLTSGSTGEPKGVMIEHRGILRLLDHRMPWRIGPGDRMLQMAPVAFDAATLEIWLPLLSGATVVLAPDEPPDLHQLAGLIETQKISALWLTAGLFHVMAEYRPDTLAGVRRLLAGGEILDPQAVQSVLRLMPPDHVLINGYGPTESTTFASYHAMLGGSSLPDHDSVPIGRPLPGTTLRVLDPVGAPCPIGVPGELFIGGTGLARGYLNASDLTAARFTTDVGGYGDRLYRTGDLASWRPTGSLSFHGRTDDQIKVRGHRIEVAEIANAMREHPAVARAVVVPSRADDATGNHIIVAYWTSRPGTTATAAELRSFLADRLPQAMIPSAFVALDRIPLKRNGKLDREALPEPFTDDGSTAPETPAEHRLHAIWAEILGHSRFGTTDNFFMVGGHSLQAVRLHARINEVFHATFPFALVIGSPTIRQQGQWLSGEVSATTGDNRLVTIQPAGERVPLIGVHGWGGTLYHFIDIARELAPHRPFLGLQPAELHELSNGISVEALAAAYAESIIARVPDGPLHLVGHSAGGWYAHAVAAALIERGRTIGLLAVLDSHATVDLDPDVRLAIEPLQKQAGYDDPAYGEDMYVLLTQRFRPPRLPVAVDLFGPGWSMELLRLTWQPYALNGIRSHVMLGSHLDFLQPEHAPAVARALESALALIETAADSDHSAEQRRKSSSSGG